MKEPKRTKTAAYWVGQIETYERDSSTWETKSEKIVKRYKEDRPENAKNRAQYNILWSNIQTLSPALFAKTPTVNIDRRFEDDDKLGQVSSRVLERCTQYFVDTELFFNVMKQCVQDRLLAGRGIAWVRYTVDEKQLTDDIPTESVYENVVIDYVHWKDFGHTWARTWEELDAVWRKVYMGRDDLEARFKNGKDIPLDDMKSQDEKSTSDSKQACIYEIWSKKNKKVYWIHKSMPDVLDVADDPLGLKDFFPCPKPLFATLGNDNLLPTPDFLQYQDQAMELDELTGRINSITKSLKVAGVYDKNAQGIERLLSEGVENKLIPVEQWAVFAEKGGLTGVMAFLPIKEIVDTLIALYDAREKVKQDLYEITGISDIIRGATNANETATAQQIKGQFATLRLDAMKDDVARFSRELVRIIAEVIAEHFSVETIAALSGVILDQEEGIGWDQIKQLIADDTLRCYRISIETDSTIKADQDAEKQARIEFLTAAGSFIQQAVQVPNPELYPLLMEMLLFGVRGFKVSRDLESTFEVAMKQIKERAENPQPPQPSPEEEKMKMEMQMKGQELQMKAQSEAQKLQIDMEKAKGDLAMKQQELQIKAQELALKEKELVLKEREMAINAEMAMEKTVLERERTQHEYTLKNAQENNEGLKMRIQSGGYVDPAIIDRFEELMVKEDQKANQLLQAMEILNNTLNEIKRPKNVAVIRDKAGKIQGASVN